MLGDAAGTAVNRTDGSDVTGLGVDGTGNRSAGGWCDARRRGAIFNALLPLCCCLCYAFRVLPSIAVDGSAGMAAQYGWSNSEKGRCRDGRRVIIFFAFGTGKTPQKSQTIVA